MTTTRKRALRAVAELATAAGAKVTGGNKEARAAIKRAKATKTPGHEKCPACDKPIIPPAASRSRYVQLFICSDCGVKEATTGFFWGDRYDKALTSGNPFSQPDNYNPWKV
jgi:hypothetical protein